MDRPRLRWIVGGCAVAAALSLLLPSAPSYDPWAWLIWGRELADGQLETRGGPAFKPLPVAVAALLSPLGGAAPTLWLLVARTGALLAAVLAWRLAARLGGGRAGGVAAAAGVLLTAGWVRIGAPGGSEGLLLALVLIAADRHLDGRPRHALGLGFAAALVRVEAWPFLAAYGVWVWRRDAAVRPWLTAGALAVPAAWFVPELLGSGDLLRSSERARVVEPGAPALAALPALASLRSAAGLPFAPLLAGCALALIGWRRRALPGRALAPLAAGGAWCGVVAAMSQAGYSGEARYALPGAALAAVTGACGVAWAGRAAAAAVPGPTAPPVAVTVGALAVCAPFAVTRAAGLVTDVRALSDAAQLSGDLDRALAAAGGRNAVLRCGRPYVGPRRAPLLAWHLAVPKARVGFTPRAPGVVFRSSLRREDAAAPDAPAGFALRARAGRWTVMADCRSPG